MAWKYVILQVGNTEIPVIFPQRMVHLLVAESLKDYFVREVQLAAGPLPVISTQLRAQLRVVAAGELEMVVMNASGSSETLKIPSRPQDKDVINSHPYTGGVVE